MSRNYFPFRTGRVTLGIKIDIEGLFSVVDYFFIRCSDFLVIVLMIHRCDFSFLLSGINTCLLSFDTQIFIFNDRIPHMFLSTLISCIKYIKICKINM